MVQDIWSSLEWLLGLGLQANEMELHHVVLRGLVIYVVAVFLVRVGDQRFLGKNAAIDVILGIILGATLSRAINGSAAFFPTITIGLLLVGLHWIFALLNFHSDTFGRIINGKSRQLMKDGEIQDEMMRKTHIKPKELASAARLQAHVSGLDEIKEAYMERSGVLTVVRNSGEPTVLEVNVANGVQTIRIKIE